MRRRVTFVTLSRSDYASLRPVIRAALADGELDVTVVAGGSHLLARFGRSIDEIAADGIAVNRVVDFLEEDDDTPAELAHAYARACRDFAQLLGDEPPDLLFILGDRWEMLAAATTASLLRIPIVHHSGGDITQGSADNQNRYALSALAHLHLVALEQHRDRLVRLGEEDWRVVCVGEPALTEVELAYAGDIHRELGLTPSVPFVLATYHPTSFDDLDFEAQVRFFISALELIDMDIVVTAPNPDAGSKTIYRELHDFAARRPRVHLFENLGPARYHAAMGAAEFMIGNSSSGIWEAPSFGLPAINLGNRQRDRLRGENVIDVGFDLTAVGRAIGRVEEIRSLAALRQRRNPYCRDDTLQLILNALKQDLPRSKLLAKEFVDPPGEA